MTAENEVTRIGAPTEAELRRVLAESRVAEAMRLVEQAQNLLARAARNLCPIIGAVPQHRQAAALSDRCRAFWGELERFGKRKGYRLDGAAEGLVDRAEVER